MKNKLWIPAVTATATALMLGACSAAHEQHASFPFSGHDLTIHSGIPMKVKIESGEEGSVTVSLKTSAVGKNTSTDDWHLDGSELNLGNPCNGYVGLCEGIYTITVPAGTHTEVAR